MKIKDSTHIIVKSHHPARKSLFVSLIVIAVMAASYLLFEYGRYSSGFDSTGAKRERDALESSIKDLEEEISRLAKQNEILVQGKEIDRVAYGEIDRSLTDLQNENMELKEEVAFYRGIVGSAEEARGLQIRNFKLVNNGASQNYRYRLILTQYVRGNRFISGYVNLSVSGVHEGTEKQLLQKEFVKQAKEDMKFHFKYFQEIQGEIVFPEGFVPLTITLSIIPQDQSHKTIEKTFNWSEVIT